MGAAKTSEGRMNQQRARSRNWDIRRLKGIYYTLDNIANFRPELAIYAHQAKRNIDFMLERMNAATVNDDRAKRIDEMLEGVSEV